MHDINLSLLLNRRIAIPQDPLPTTDAARMLDIQERMRRSNAFVMPYRIPVPVDDINDLLDDKNVPSKNPT